MAVNIYWTLFIVFIFSTVKSGNYGGKSKNITKSKSAIKLTKRSALRKVFVEKGRRKINDEEYQ
jgi:hypothetical protein